MMKIKIFDESHEQDLEIKVNEFLSDLRKEQIIDLKYQLAIMYDEREQIYCFSCMIIYEDNID
ncbi:MAG: sporulation protein Cse60 [Bacilli bacterium]|nr:sporulation protein Cse60 [Bacilli bacterium]